MELKVKTSQLGDWLKGRLRLFRHVVHERDVDWVNV